MRHTRVVAQAVQGATTWHITTVARRQERSQLSCLRGDVVVTREVLRHQKFHDTGQGDANGHGVGVNSLSPSSIVGSTARHHKQGPARDTGQGLLAHTLAERFVALLAGAGTDIRADVRIETKLSGGRNVNSRLLQRRQRLAGHGSDVRAATSHCGFQHVVSPKHVDERAVVHSGAQSTDTGSKFFREGWNPRQLLQVGNIHGALRRRKDLYAGLLGVVLHERLVPVAGAELDTHIPGGPSRHSHLISKGLLIL